MNTTSELRFLLDGETVCIPNPPTTTTVLNWLREERGRCGTKEGCAEGDCGACTVVVADLDDGRLRWRAVNACIRFLPTLHGKAIFTVESLRGAGGELHPAQQAMIECHASQCGFCTPGFVMSLFALYRSKAAPSDAEIGDALSGNLCRCTGYRPILAAARRMYDYPAPPPTIDDAELARRLAALDDARTFAIEHPDGRFFAPATLADFATLRAAYPDATILAGGTDVGLWVTKALRALPTVLHVGRVKALCRIDDADGRLMIGAAATLEDAFAALVRHYPETAELYRRFASLPIRNAGTLCGNIANGSPIGDAIPALIALGAEVVVRHASTQRRLPLEAFYLDYRKQDLAPGEFVEAVSVPLRPTAEDSRRRFHFCAYKVSKRHDQDISAVFAGLAVQLEDGVVASARLAFGGMAATPKRALRAEAALTGRRFDASAIAAAAAALERDFAPLTDMRASAAYRLRVAQNLFTRFHLEATGGAITRVTDRKRLHETP